jgi:hypothetical protein
MFTCSCGDIFQTAKEMYDHLVFVHRDQIQEATALLGDFCSTCGQEIAAGEPRAYHAPTVSHIRCAKRAKAHGVEPACQGCGGPHPFDTTIPSPLWNQVVRARKLPEFLCASCILRVFAGEGVSFTAELWGDRFTGMPIEVRVRSAAAEVAALLNAENTTLRAALVKAMVPLEGLNMAVDWELAPAVKATIADAVRVGRAALG